MKKNWKKYLLLALICFLCYVPYLIIFFPGLCNWDTIGQISDFFGGNSPIPFGWMEGQEEITPFLSDHHPFFDTIVFSLFVKLGLAIFNSANAGFFIYVLLQAVAFSITFSFVIYVLNRLKVGKKFQIMAGLFYVLFLPIPLYAIDMLKDSLFTLCFIWYFLIYILTIIETPTKKKIIALIILSILLGLTKKTGVYISIFTALAILPKIWRRYKPMGIIYVIACPLVMFVLVAKIIFPVFDIEPGGKQELLAIPIQQLSKAAMTTELSPEEKETINRVIDYEQISSLYRSDLVDPIKGTFRYGTSDQDIMEFLKLWAKIGIKHPKLYFHVSYDLVGGFFVPNKNINIPSNIPEPWRGGPSIYQPDIFSSQRQLIVDFYYKIADTPIIGFFYKIALYTFIIPVCASIYLLIRRRYLVLRAFVPIFLIIMTLFICPTTNARYGLPLIMTAPLIIGLCLMPYEKIIGNNKKKKKRKRRKKEEEEEEEEKEISGSLDEKLESVILL